MQLLDHEFSDELFNSAINCRHAEEVIRTISRLTPLNTPCTGQDYIQFVNEDETRVLNLLLRENPNKRDATDNLRVLLDSKAHSFDPHRSRM